MNVLVDSYKKTGTLHHAYLVEGSAELVVPELFSFIENELGHKVRGNPDLWHGRFETLSIDDARALRERQSTKPLGNQRKIFIVETQFMTVEAQNSLLKMFEEPTTGTHFFIISPTAEAFLPTLRSRLMVIPAQTDTAEYQPGNQQKLVGEFLTATIPERFKLVGGIIEEKNKIQAIDLVESLIRILRQKIQPDQNQFIFEQLLACRGYLNDRSPSVKLILEHLALIVPEFLLP